VFILDTDAITHDPSEPMSKSAAVPRVKENLMLAKEKLPPGAITVSCVLELWNLTEAEKILEVDFDDGQSFAFPAELLRVESPSAEVQGHTASQKQTIAGRRHVGIVGLKPIAAEFGISRGVGSRDIQYA